MYKLFFLFSFFALTIARASPTKDYCSRRWFGNVTILNKEEAQKSELLQGSLRDFRDEKIIAVLNAKVPILCEGAIVGFPKLQHLQLSKLGIKEVRPHPFRNVPMLKRLFLNGNELVHVPNGVFSGLGLERLDLSKNKISTIEQFAFDNMVDLVQVDLEDNKLRKVNPNWFYNCPRLVKLNFQRNHLKELPAYSFRYIKGGQGDAKPEINLQFNRISKMGAKVFGGFEDGVLVLLDNNKLEDIPEELFEGKSGNVMELSLSRNLFKCLPDAVLYMFDATCSSVSVEDNPLECDCKRRLKKYAGDRYKVLDFAYENDIDCD